MHQNSPPHFKLATTTFTKSKCVTTHLLSLWKLQSFSPVCWLFWVRGPILHSSGSPKLFYFQPDSPNLKLIPTFFLFGKTEVPFAVFALNCCGGARSHMQSCRIAATRQSSCLAPPPTPCSKNRSSWCTSFGGDKTKQSKKYFDIIFF